MREIKFRGKCSQSKRWVYGWLLTNKLGTYIVTEENPHECTQNHYIEIDEYCRVVPSTVGQYTGLRDKNGKEIYEGDIVLATLKFFNINNEKCKVIFHNGSFGVQYGFSTDYFKTFSAWDEVEVIGNIHDNPER